MTIVGPTRSNTTQNLVQAISGLNRPESPAPADLDEPPLEPYVTESNTQMDLMWTEEENFRIQSVANAVSRAWTNYSTTLRGGDISATMISDDPSSPAAEATTPVDLLLPTQLF